ncbi:MAG: hypothetical protein FWC06_07345 [Treponema sp.]|nr:hypothetical protein [Treponema sp.]
MRKGVFIVLIILAVLLVSVSCGSAPLAGAPSQYTAPMPTSVPAPVPMSVQTFAPAAGLISAAIPESAPVAAFVMILTAASEPASEHGLAAARAEESRKRAIDFECPAYFPSDWEAAEAQLNAAGDPNAYNAAADVYDDLFRKTVPLYAQAREDEIISVRKQLIDTGLAQRYPVYLRNADRIALAALDQYEAGDYYTSKSTAVAALDEYEILLLGANTYLARQRLADTGLTHLVPKYIQNADHTALTAADQYEEGNKALAGISANAALNEYEDLLLGADVYLIREEIIDRGFVQYDTANFLRADVAALAAASEFGAGDRNAAVFSAQEALLRYNIMLSNGWISYSSDRRQAASEERELALAERANIAARETFRTADTMYAQAGALFTSGDYHSASLVFVEAEAMFAISRKETAESRRRAQEAIRMAEERISASNETALEAERIIEGGSR